jgi:outer membrane protein TolC
VLDVWGQNRDAGGRHRSSHASGYQVEVVRLTTRASVVNNFLIYAANRERVTLARENLRSAERILGVIRQRRAAGTASELDVAQQESLVEIQRAQIPPLRQAAELPHRAGDPTGQPAGRAAGDPQRAQAAPADSLGGLPTALLFRRPDICSAEQQLKSADANVEVARKAFRRPSR